ncbi:LamG domain-containing protein [Clostridium brassicae]|uniref:LamG domain-containing protein n=1 Tax=Clostridium brassicae TaxID=2999072 RepID=A0ABT4D632_9CLOT|nr:LamG domain-containing protein [Clostridium brassicae]MCY6957750.1 LamG domain-containing protein [Clostridium brassicae]
MFKENFAIELLNKETYALEEQVALDVIPSQNNLYLPKNGELTIEMKMMPKLKYENTIISYYCYVNANSEIFDGYFKFTLIRENILVFQIYYENKDITKSVHTINLCDSKWHHVAVSLKNTDIIIYVDGQECESCKINFNNESFKVRDIHNSASSILRIGASVYMNHPCYFGQLDEIRIWNCVRNNKEICEFMNETLEDKTKRLLGYWNFDDKNTKDLSGFSNNLRIAGKEYNMSYVPVSSFKNFTTSKACYDVKHITSRLIKSLLTCSK